ncbi:alpha/beta hydrolase [uncultured Sphingomonas sp.]|uniref:alpha/beta hydrolase n=1 Tax=uncultured Sphingomonas sp. TaxID=158754 RepID=UPI0035CC1A6A
MTDATPYVRPDVAAFLAYLNAVPGPKMYELEAPAARATYLAMKDVVDPPVGELATIVDLAIPSPDGDIPARLFDARASREPGPVVIFAHGGGFVLGNVDTHASFCAEAARQLDLPVVSVDYRLAPEHRWPAAPDDVEAAARWVAGSPAALLGRHVTGLVLMGDSAGGTLSIITAMALRDAPAAVPVLVQAPIYPATDWDGDYPSMRAFSDGYLLTDKSMAWFRDSYQADLSHSRGSPKAGSVAGLPRAVIVTAGLDPIRDQGRDYAARLIEAGIPVVYREAAGTIHGFVTLRRAIPSSVGDVAAYLAAVKAAVAEAVAR